MKTTYEIITNHQKFICTLNILESIEDANNKIIQARMLVEDEIQDSWVLIRKLEAADAEFSSALQVGAVN